MDPCRGSHTRSPRSRVEDNGRITLVTLTDTGHEKVIASAPPHVETVRRLVIDPLTKQQLIQLGRASETILTQLIPTGERPPWPN
jgi:DNA-binding MarR family transcriptional regulator